MKLGLQADDQLPVILHLIPEEDRVDNIMHRRMSTLLKLVLVDNRPQRECWFLKHLI